MKQQVKESEKSRVLSSKDYSMFDFPDFKVSKKHLDKMKESIQEKNLSKDFPILVSVDDYKIIEGRYRFLACYDLQLPIFYKIAEVTTHKDAIRIKHIHKNIHIDDIINIYAEIKSYGDILKIKDELGGFFSLTDILYTIDEVRFADGEEKNGYMYHPRINRKMIDSGTIPDWEYPKVRARLVRIKGFLQKYSDFGWKMKDAVTLLHEKARIFSTKEDELLKKADTFRGEYINIGWTNGRWDESKKAYPTAPDGSNYSSYEYVLPNGERFIMRSNRELICTYNFLTHITQNNFNGVSHQTKQALKKANIKV